MSMMEEKGEETKVTIRNIRRETNKEIDAQEEEGEITEDDKYMLEDEVDDITSSLTGKVDELVENKTERIRAV